MGIPNKNNIDQQYTEVFILLYQHNNLLLISITITHNTQHTT